jgi:hypothetical protein
MPWLIVECRNGSVYHFAYGEGVEFVFDAAAGALWCRWGAGLITEDAVLTYFRRFSLSCEAPYIVKDSIGNFFVEVAQGADRIILTPPLWNLTEASDARKRIAAVTGLRDGRSV